jgi:acetylornithine/N-succinyldiaminopimelate aminotransferase
MSALMPTYARTDLAFESGEGAYLTSTSGERYLDFGAGIAVTSLGHAHPALVEALSEQAAKLWHTSNLYRIEDQERLGKRLVAATFADLMFATNSGTEAVECAIKVARRYHFANGAQDRYRLITFDGAFHGRTLAALAAGGQEKQLEGFGAPVEGFDSVPFGDLETTEAAIGDHTAGILVEPIQGESGIQLPPDGFLRGLRDLCDDHGLLLIFDEVQTGMGRTGKLFAHEWVGVEPDVMTVAKGLGGGFPVGACLTTRAAGEPMTAGSHGSTFGGNPLAMAVANRVLDIVSEPEFLPRVQERGLRLKQKLAGLQDEHDGIIQEIRGRGLMLGLKCKIPNIDMVKALIGQRMLSVPAGDNVVRLIPPLIIGDVEIDDACNAIDAACQTLTQGDGATPSRPR